MHVNIFETKSDDELSVLYEQFLEAEKIGSFSDDNELGKIKKEYQEDFGANTMLMLQIELTHTIADRWYKNKKNPVRKYKYKVDLSADDATVGYIQLTSEEAKIVEYATNEENWDIVKQGEYSGLFEIDVNNPIEI
jgi:hypothetical protein|uniref:Uncharacterized protein n=1 Tax=virus sp. ctmTa7 TaxID=2828255 RepID=A0A8S5RC83_9VIRU|nr:MAG TPA: hypothetical protein [virus sp. ctmTa7]